MHNVEPADETRNSTPSKTSLVRMDFTDLMEKRDIYLILPFQAVTI